MVELLNLSLLHCMAEGYSSVFRVALFSFIAQHLKLALHRARAAEVGRQGQEGTPGPLHQFSPNLNPQPGFGYQEFSTGPYQGSKS